MSRFPKAVHQLTHRQWNGGVEGLGEWWLKPQTLTGSWLSTFKHADLKKKIHKTKFLSSFMVYLPEILSDHDRTCTYSSTDRYNERTLHT